MERITKIDSSGQKKKLRVAAYARVSTDSDDQLISLEAQKNHYESYIKARKDWEYAGLYYDEGISGTKTDKRDGLLRMLSDCDCGRIDYIIIKSISRFSRNTLDCIEMVRHLSEKGIFIFFEKENIDTGRMEGELLLSILSSLAENESRSISDNENWSIQKRFQDGTFILVYPPYGYKRDGRKWVIDEEQAKIVRWIFQEVLSGSSANQVAKELNRRGIPSKKGGRWEGSVVSRMIRNEKYIGDALMQKTYTDDRFSRHMNRGQKQQYYITGHHEPIISHEDYETANMILDVNAKEKGNEKNDSDYLNRTVFSGNIICGECGGKFRRRHTDRLFGYACIRHIRDRHSCGMVGIVPEDDIKAAFVTMMNKLTFSKGKVLIPYREMLKEQIPADRLEAVDAFDRKLEENYRNRQKLLEFFTKSYIDPVTYAERNDALLEEESKLNRERSAAAKKINGEDGRASALELLIKQAAKGKMMMAFDEELFRRHIDHIVVFGKTEIGFAMKCGPVFRERLD